MCTANNRTTLALAAITVVVALAIALATFGYRSIPKVPVLHVDPKNVQGEIMIRSWRMIGPFQVSEEQLTTAGHSNGAAGLDRDYIAAIGFPENSISPVEFAGIHASVAVPGASTAIKNIRVDSEGELIELTRYFEFGEYGIAYAAVQIDSPVDADLAMPCSNTHGMKIWLNHENILTTGYSTGAQKFQHVLRVRLKRGRNFLLLKKTAIKDTPVGYGYPAAFSVGLSSFAYAKEMQKVVCWDGPSARESS